MNIISATTDTPPATSARATLQETIADAQYRNDSALLKMLSTVQGIVEVELEDGSEESVNIYGHHFTNIADINIDSDRFAYYMYWANKLNACLTKIRRAHENQNATQLHFAKIDMEAVAREMVLHYR